ASIIAKRACEIETRELPYYTGFTVSHLFELLHYAFMTVFIPKSVIARSFSSVAIHNFQYVDGWIASHTLAMTKI
ncbi:MAG: hypothetical protein ABL867_09575, partial [Rickettsiales bacterium]